MIDALLKLLDRLTQLVKRRKEVEEKTFELLIQPMYTDLETIHKDYLKLIDNCRRDIKKGNKLEDIAKQLSIDRLEMEPLRQRIIPFVRSYMSNSKLSGYELFFREVEDYLHVPGYTRNLSWTRVLKNFLEGRNESLLGKSDQESEPSRFDVLEFVDECLFTIRMHWEIISEEYAKILAKRATS